MTASTAETDFSLLLQRGVFSPAMASFRSMLAGHPRARHTDSVRTSGRVTRLLTRLRRAKHDDARLDGGR